jgi:dTMP kinase
VSATGRFITFEGIEGAGKSTQIERLRGWLADQGIDALFTREPGGTPLAEELRGLLLTPRDEAVDPRAEVLMVFAARAQHLWTRIVPAMSSGRWVVSDRFTDASYAYQGEGRGLGAERIGFLEAFVQDELRPDLTLVLDLSVASGRKRISARGGDIDRFEGEQAAFFEKIRNAYLARAAACPDRYAVIDASASEDEVFAHVTVAITSRLF